MALPPLLVEVPGGVRAAGQLARNPALHRALVVRHAVHLSGIVTGIPRPGDRAKRLTCVVKERLADNFVFVFARFRLAKFLPICR